MQRIPFFSITIWWYAFQNPINKIQTKTKEKESERFEIKNKWKCLGSANTNMFYAWSGKEEEQEEEEEEKVVVEEEA